MRVFFSIVALAGMIGAIVFFIVLPPRIDDKMNAVLPHTPYQIGAEARALHDDLRVADLHADTVLWMRDPAKRHNRGQTDLPRLREGGYALQVFTSVTKTPSDLNYDRNESISDDITLLAIAQRWPMKTWDSLFERALYHAARLRRLEVDAAAEFAFVTTAAELEAALAAGKLAGIFGIEGAHPLEGDIEKLDRLYDAGLRVIGLQHFFDNELGGSLHGVSGEGLTAFGRTVVIDAAAKGMIIDVAHSSEASVRDVLAITDTPLIVSHTGLKGHCDSPRNIDDDLMREIAVRGGLIGVGFWDGAVCSPAPEYIAEAIVYAVGLLGADHVALGSDFDGTVTTAFDASEAAALTAALLSAGLDDETIRAVMGENAIRFFRENLPQ